MPDKGGNFEQREGEELFKIEMIVLFFSEIKRHLGDKRELLSRCVAVV